MQKKFIWAGTILLAVLLVGTVGYWLLTGRDHSFIDCLYMTVISITTIGYGEVIDLADNASGRIFTMFIAVAGIGVLAYILTNLTALVVEGEITKSFRRRRMEKTAMKTRDHYIVCGAGTVARHIINELRATQRPHILVDCNKDNIEAILNEFPDEIFVEGDATDEATLIKAGIDHAAGLFAVTTQDNQNLVITFTARQLNSKMRIVTRCTDPRHTSKIKRAGADAVVSPTFIGGLRMASEMVRPTVVSFLDTMLRDADIRLRVEEVSIPASHVGKSIAGLNLKKFSHLLLLAVKRKDDWIYNPVDDYITQTGDTLVFMATPDERDQLESIFFE